MKEVANVTQPDYKLMVDYHGPLVFPSNEGTRQLINDTVLSLGINLPSDSDIIDFLLNRPEELTRVIDGLPEIQSPPIAGADIYFYTTNRTDRSTCEQACNWCFLRAKPQYAVSLDKAAKISADLKAQGLNIGMVPPDSFGQDLMNGAENIQQQAGSAYRMEGLENTAWSSGTPIATAQNSDELLNKGWKIMGYRSIQMNGQEVAGTPVPATGIARPDTITEAVRRIQKWNKGKLPEEQYKIGLTFTMTKINNTLESMKMMIKWCVDNGIFSIRFNSFSAFTQDRLPQLDIAQYELQPDDIRTFYDNLKTLMDELSSMPQEKRPKISFSEDLGDWGNEQIEGYIPDQYKKEGIGLCRSGAGLFALVEENGRLILYSCVDRFFPKAGEVKQNELGEWYPEWDKKVLKAIYYFRRVTDSSGQPLLRGCFGGISYTQNLNNQRFIKFLKQISQ